MKTDVILTVASWEDRFILGLEKNIVDYRPDKVIIFKYHNINTEKWKISNIERARSILGDKMQLVDIGSDIPSTVWKVFKTVIENECVSKSVLIDITTMARESIWYCIYNCRKLKCNTSFVYYKPKKYSDTWLSRDPGKPRLLYKMSGIAKLGTPTLLVVTGGYDLKRLDSLIFHFEPQRTMLFLQYGDNERNKKNFEECKSFFGSKYNIDMVFEYNAYDIENATSIIKEQLESESSKSGKPFYQEYNIIFNSLGAKTSAIPLFNIWNKNADIALSYIPSREYNENYSSGIGEKTSGEIRF